MKNEVVRKKKEKGEGKRGKGKGKRKKGKKKKGKRKRGKSDFFVNLWHTLLLIIVYQCKIS